MPQNSLGFVRSAANPGNPCAAPGKMPHLPYVLGLPDACGAPSQMNVLVTGATGAIGADLVPRLAAAGHRVRGVRARSARVTDRGGERGRPRRRGRGDRPRGALDGVDTAYFLIHSMERRAADPATGFADRDRRAAGAVRRRGARAPACERVVYLGGLVPSARGRRRTSRAASRSRRRCSPPRPRRSRCGRRS